MINEVPYDQVLEIRHKVMYADKPKEVVILADDDKGIHIGYHKNDNPVSVVSIFLNNGELQFRKLATLEEFQGKDKVKQALILPSCLVNIQKSSLILKLNIQL